MQRAAFLLSSFLIISAGAAGCDRRALTAPTQVVSEQFSGQLAQQGANAHPFTVQEDGPVSITVLSVVRETPPLPEDAPAPDTSQPPSTEDDPTAAIPPPIYIGLGIGTWDGVTCGVIARRTDASLLSSISGTAVAGNFCVSVFDPGGDVVTHPVNYQLEVNHY